ncbi:MAG TPA: hypothetical protein VLA19_12990 [Herpetosiphonaceae bacterium]|nr:hypothetical protein [Herpetosiphonaceae bacterium]
MAGKRWLGYVAVGLGALALLAALNGRSGSYIAVEVPSAPPFAPVPTVVLPRMPEPPLMPARPPELVVPRDFSGFHHGPGARIERELEYVWRGNVHSGWGWPFGGIFGAGRWVMDGLLRFALAFLLIALGLRFLRGRRGGSGTSSSSPDDAPPTPMGGPPTTPPPGNRPPHMGETTYL